MKKYFSIVLTILVLLGITIGTVVWAQAFYESVKTYRSPLRDLELPTQPVVLPKTAKIVIVLISGLGYEAAQSLNLPVFNQLVQTGATMAIQSEPPTYSQTARLSLITGAPADMNGAPPIDQPLENLSPTPIDTIFARAHDAQLKTTLLGRDDWQYLVPAADLDETFFVNVPGLETDQAILQAALPLIKNNQIDLVFIQFTGLEFAAKQQGGLSSNIYQVAASTIDFYLGHINRTVDLNNTVLMILGDHGLTESGGHGGDEIEITRQPLIVIGKNIIPGSYTDIRQIDIAPTISTILGLPSPKAAHGRILFEMLNLNERSRTLAQLTLTQLRVALAEAYVTQIKGSGATLPVSLLTDVIQAEKTFDQNNLGGAFQLALLTRENADSQMAAAKSSQIRIGQWLRLAAVIIVVLIWFLSMWRRRGRHASLIVMATLVTLGLYHTLFQLQGHSYSISSFNNLTQLPFDVARRSVVSLLAGGALVLVFLMLVNEENWVTLLGTGYGFSLFATFIFALPLFWAFWQNGFTIDWYLPAVGPVFWQIIGLLEVMMAAIVGLLLPWPIMLLNVFVNWVRRHLSDHPSRPEQDALPGLRL
jgi:hypothetical protein